MSPGSILLDGLNVFIEVLLWKAVVTLVVTFGVLLWWKLTLFA